MVLRRFLGLGVFLEGQIGCGQVVRYIMVSSIDSLFGEVTKGKIDSSVDSLFANSSRSIDEQQLKLKHRTELPTVVEPVQEDVTAPSASASGALIDEEVKVAKKSKKPKKTEEDDLEGKYYAKLLEDDKDKSAKDVKKETKSESGSVSDLDSDSDAEDKVEKKTEKSQAATTLDLKEDELEKAKRTVFIGNVPNTVITSRNIYKQFKKLFSLIDEKKFSIETIRFRSISFDEALPRKVAFVQQKLHKSRNSINAYIVYKEKSSVNPICTKLNGTVFQKNHLRVDSVSNPAAHENKRSIFVGNMDFEQDEETLWSHFESCGEIEYVRIIRDSKTNLGKGFAYIQFKDLQSVNKALLLNDKKFDNTKTTRKLRVSRCKNIKKPSSSSATSNNKQKLNESQKTKIGRAKRILGKADRATAGEKITIEGLRAAKGQTASSHLKRKKERSKTGRVTKRSIAFKKAQAKDSSKN
ncbi:hypothetical protein Kpol_1040p23 [Vanderwaltozyma polyspora DSM 70294]|uniref:Nucleolar protein 12 n=1 Tax=Vanderwaltozyma polyspora (strain ATCC 22028 / DSM 70294 / BCRC 21397 / CBS 2163 / NBRC 10782 / NRRL Y-8283 / UCD 57-17) TaxID=436907 RepID=A7TPL8_VANPO|nr:uncharacterized protein Kpol_1040p23 [Vanderwaltozyma polyspora DSM 70294]EDO15810.1 hypothetical protein Kpol_1040p23 [Vanderwaltozyma polyspora DSM 70294]